MAQQTPARLFISDGTTTIDFLDPGGGWVVEDPGWRPAMSTLKGGGDFVNASLAEGHTLVHGEYGDVTETIPLLAYGTNRTRAINTLRELLRLLRQASDYWRRPFEYDPVWLGLTVGCDDCPTSYCRVIQGTIADAGDPFRQPFFSSYDLSRLDALTLVVEREPFWQPVQPGTVMGPLFNMLKNPDFELWTEQPGAVADTIPDSWVNYEVTGFTGSNNRALLPHSGRYCLKVDVDTLYGAGSKGVYQVVADTEDLTTYTMVAWCKNEGINYGTGRLLVTYGANELEVYRRADRHGWKLYTGKFTTDVDDVVTVYAYILGTGVGAVYVNATGAVYFDSLMLLEGDWEAEAAAGTLPYLSSSHVVNHWDQPGSGNVEAGDINFLDVWDVPGDVDGLIRLEMVNNTTPSDWNAPVEVIDRARVGMRRTGDVFDFANVHDPAGQVDTSCGGDDMVVIDALGTEWTVITSQVISGGELTPDNVGRFRLLARVHDEIASGDPTVELRLRYWLGAAGVNVVTLDTVKVPVARGWCMVDLTPRQAINWDAKFLADQPGSLGWQLEARRTSGSAQFDFDYALLVPGDGGIITADIDPPLTPDNSLVVDGTAFQSVQASARRSGLVKLLWEDSGASATSEVYALKSYLGDLFACGALSTAAASYQTRYWDGTTWTVLTHSYIVTALGEFDGVLYAGTDGGVVYQWTGSAWSSLYSTPAAVQITDMAAYDGSLYVLNNAGNAYAYTGAAWSNPFNVAGGGDYGKLAVYNNRLFASQGAGGGAVSVWDGAALSTLGTPAGMTEVTALTALTAQGGYLWIGGNGPTIAYYDGDSITVDTAFITGLDDTEQCYDLCDYDGALYLATTWTGGRSGRIYRRASGGTWSGFPQSRLSGAHSYRRLTVHDGSLYAGSLGYVAQAEYAGVLALSNVDIWYKVTDYRGTPFACPREERHRYVFSWDRRDRRNNIDDKALVGVGFVPRYFALRGDTE